jgi:hypothetical protein
VLHALACACAGCATNVYGKVEVQAAFLDELQALMAESLEKWKRTHYHLSPVLAGRSLRASRGLQQSIPPGDDCWSSIIERRSTNAPVPWTSLAKPAVGLC